MFEYNNSLVFYAQKYVASQLVRKATKKSIDPVWGSKSLNLGPDEYGLIVSKDKKRIAFTFTKAELIEGYGTSEWKDRLSTKTNNILRRIET